MATLTLRSSDGKEFTISKSIAIQLSPILKNKAEEGGSSGDGVIPLPDIDGGTLEMVVAYLNTHGGEVALSDEEKKSFDRDFASGEEFSVLREIIMAGHNLGIKDLVDIMAQKMADVIKTKPSSWVIKEFGIPELTPERKAEMSRKYPNIWDDCDDDDDDDYDDDY